MYDAEAIKPLLKNLQEVHEQLGHTIKRLQSYDELRCMRWRCTDCGYIKHFTRPMPAEVAPPCPKCEGKHFVAIT